MAPTGEHAAVEVSTIVEFGSGDRVANEIRRHGG
jgi:hypothetical protein